MSIAATDLLFYNSANMPADDVSTSGGAIDALRRPVFTQLAANDTLEMLSSAAGDTSQTVTVTGRNAAGARVSDTKTLNGTSVVAFTGTFERVLKVEMSATAAGTITVRRNGAGATVGTIPIGERGFTAMFDSSASDPSVQKDRYMKIFLKNAHATLTLNTAEVTLTADPATKIKIGLATAIDDSGSVSNRVTAPGSVSYSDDGVVLSVPGGILAAGSAIGTWVNQTLAAADAAFKNTFTIQLAGTSV